MGFEQEVVLGLEGGALDHLAALAGAEGSQSVRVHLRRCRHRSSSPGGGRHHVRRGHASVQPGLEQEDALVGQEWILAVVGQVQELDVLPAGRLVEHVDGGVGGFNRGIQRHFVPVVIIPARPRVAVLVGRNRQGVALSRQVVS